ncbi:hypothetical protein [Mycobacterium mantenii]|uniref:Uncharacterized protein n=1 Tax=Mycobacterium mantenii TaxID=560555 RepID=A0A1A2TK16_MYCNT|nr:hypothetical protein [Mycobacterium mantenii]OBH40436.1 hypothetical protein A5688_19645 [Mycobacterium mantenii]OBH76786.1 hypothetical protein A5683_20345 [Mycobacterium mantenii]
MADTPGNEAARRSQELLRRGRELADGHSITEADVRRAAERAESAHARDEEAHRRESRRHYEAAIAHERAAEIQELAVAEGLGDVDAHKRAAEREREAARRNFVAAQEAVHPDAD